MDKSLARVAYAALMLPGCEFESIPPQALSLNVKVPIEGTCCPVLHISLNLDTAEYKRVAFRSIVGAT